jgi:ankyrin repeat protein
VNAKLSNNSYTSLIWASENGHLEVVRALLDAKANVNAKTDTGYTALQRARSEGHMDVVALLRQHGANE